MKWWHGVAAEGGEEVPGSTGTMTTANRGQPRLGLFAIWLVALAIVDPLYYISPDPHPPGRMSSTAAGCLRLHILIVLAIPVMIGGGLLAYAHHFQWRRLEGWSRAEEAARGEQLQDPDELDHHTTVLVSSWRDSAPTKLVQPEGAGGGQGRNPIWTAHLEHGAPHPGLGSSGSSLPLSEFGGFPNHSGRPRGVRSPST